MSSAEFGDPLRQLVAAGLDRSAVDILADRARWLGTEGSGEALTSVQPVAAPTGDRAFWAARMDEICGRLWAGDATELERELAEFDLRSFPEFTPTVQRLQVALAARDWLRDEEHRLGRTGEFVAALRTVLAASARRAAPVREAWMERFSRLDPGDQAVRTSALSVIETVSRDAPSLYVLEESWFDALRQCTLARPTWSQRLVNALALREVQCFTIGAIAFALAALFSGEQLGLGMLSVLGGGLAVDYLWLRKIRRDFERASAPSDA